MEKIKQRKMVLKNLVSLFAGMALLCGCAGQETTKTVILSGRAEEDNKINIKNIQECTYEEGTEDITWVQGTAGNICLIRNVDGKSIYQEIDVYRKTVQKEIVFEENPVNFPRVSPGGRYIAYKPLLEEGKRQLWVYDVETGEKEAVKEWETETSVYSLAWSGDGTKLFVLMEEDGFNQSADGYLDWSVIRYDVGSEELKISQIEVKGNGRMMRSILPNEDGTKVFVGEEPFDSWEWEEEGSYIVDADGAVNEEITMTGKDGKNWLLDMDTGKTKELVSGRLNIRNPVKYTGAGLFGTDGKKLWFACEPLEEASGKRLLEMEFEDICVCEKGDHIFLIEREEYTDYFQVTGIFLEGGEIKEYQVLYKGIYGNYDQAFTGMDDHELVIQSVGYEKDGSWLMKATVLEY